MIGAAGIDPDRALYLTPHEIHAVSDGWGQKERTRFVTVARAFGADLSEREATRIIQGDGSRTVSAEEQQRRLDELKERFGE